MKRVRIEMPKLTMVTNGSPNQSFPRNSNTKQVFMCNFCYHPKLITIYGNSPISNLIKICSKFVQLLHADRRICKHGQVNRCIFVTKLDTRLERKAPKGRNNTHCGTDPLLGSQQSLSRSRYSSPVIWDTKVHYPFRRTAPLGPKPTQLMQLTHPHTPSYYTSPHCAYYF